MTNFGLPTSEGGWAAWSEQRPEVLVHEANLRQPALQDVPLPNSNFSFPMLFTGAKVGFSIRQSRQHVLVRGQ